MAAPSDKPASSGWLPSLADMTSTVSSTVGYYLGNTVVEKDTQPLLESIKETPQATFVPLHCREVREVMGQVQEIKDSNERYTALRQAMQNDLLHQIEGDQLKPGFDTVINGLLTGAYNALRHNDLMTTSHYIKSYPELFADLLAPLSTLTALYVETSGFEGESSALCIEIAAISTGEFSMRTPVDLLTTDSVAFKKFAEESLLPFAESTDLHDWDCRKVTAALALAAIQKSDFSQFFRLHRQSRWLQQQIPLKPNDCNVLKDVLESLDTAINTFGKGLPPLIANPDFSDLAVALQLVKHECLEALNNAVPQILQPQQETLKTMEAAMDILNDDEDGDYERFIEFVNALTPALIIKSKYLKQLKLCVNGGEIDTRAEVQFRRNLKDFKQYHQQTKTKLHQSIAALECGDFQTFASTVEKFPEFITAFGTLDGLKTYIDRAKPYRAQIMHTRALLCYRNMLLNGRRDQFRLIFEQIPAGELWFHTVSSGRYDVRNDFEQMVAKGNRKTIAATEAAIRNQLR